MANIKENKRYHFTYRTTNIVNNRYYLGMHSTNRIDDGYLGSGKRLYYELNKYGRDNFKFEILEQFNSREELVQAEITLITEHDLKNPNCLNLKQGGSGGFSEEHRIKGATNAGKKHSQRMENEEEYRVDVIKKMSIGLKRAYETGKKQKNYTGWMTGRKMTPETISKMKEAKVGHGKGVENSQFGKCWITNETENKKIYKGDIIPEGWRLGRILNIK